MFDTPVGILIVEYFLQTDHPTKLTSLQSASQSFLCFVRPKFVITKEKKKKPVQDVKRGGKGKGNPDQTGY